MNEYEVFVEDINSCGGAQYAKKELGRFPILEISKNAVGDIVIVTGDGIGNMLRYTFTEC